MSRTTTLSCSCLVLLCCALTPWHGARAQGFSSVSSGAPVVSNTAPTPAPTAGDSYSRADRILIRKGERRLFLLREDRIIAEYPVRLGLNPYGHKRQEGDFRTPEGVYRLSRRNPRSDFFLSLQVSYPSPDDERSARASGVKPGGAIMIHGQPNVPRKSPDFYKSRDWTDGCIALSNADMVDVWLRTGVGIPIEIRP